MLNRVVLVGRICNELELKHTNNGTAVLKLTIACNRRYSKDETDFIQVVVWRGLAENVAKYTAKGSLVGVDGRLQIRKYENQEGRTVWATEVIADDVRFLDSKKTSQATDTSDPFQEVGTPINVDDFDGLFE